MAAKTVYFSAFDFDGLQLSGLSLGFTSPGYYLINGAPATAPTISEVGSTGTYRFTATLSEGEELAWRVDLGSTSSSKYSFGDLSYADCLVPVLESEVGPAVLAQAVSGYPSGSVGSLLSTNLDAAVSSRLASANYTAPSNTDIAAIKLKTDNLPADPADASDIRDLLLAVEGSGFDTAVDSLKEISDGVSSLSTKIGSPVVSVSADLAAVQSSISSKLDVAVSTRLAAADYTAPSNTDIAAIKAKTDNLPVDPADASDVRDLLLAVEGSGFDTAVDSLKEISDGVSSISALIGMPAVSIAADIAATKSDVGDVQTALDARLDVAVSTRLSSTSYTAPDNTSISAIKGKTDNLPSDPADASDIRDLLEAVEGSGFDTAVDSLKVLSDGVSEVLGKIGTPSVSLSADLSSFKTSVDSKLDVAVSTRLASADYAEPDLSDLAAIRERTDRLPNAPANETTVASRLAAADYVAPDNTGISAIRAKTDNLPTDPADASDINALIAAVEGAGFDTTLSSLQKISEKVGSLVTAVGTPTGASISSDLSSIKSDTSQVNTLTQAKLDATVSSRLAASSYTAPDAATLSAIKAKTDLIPSDPAQQPTVLQVKAKTDQIDVAVSTRLAAADYVPPANSDVGSIKAKTDRFLFDPANRIYANTGEDTTSAPVVSNFVPAPGTPITDRTPLGFDVTDDSGEFRRIIALVSFSNGQTDVAFDGKSFRGAYSRYSTKASITRGFRFTIYRDGRWPGSPTLEVIPIDTAGNEGS